MADEQMPEGAEAGGDEPEVQAAEFPDLDGAGATASPQPDIDMIKDIEVTLTVELGRTDMVIEEVLKLTPGKVIELDKLAGEALDIMINDKLMARGEVVVVDDRFGIRVTAIVDPRSRVAAMGPNGATAASDEVAEAAEA
ncbi:MAG: flagellar motor switch protein FliN [Planctomycetota bacterium]